MFHNYLKVALRNLLKHKAYSFINVAGLAIGMTCCILILLYVQHELSYDGHHENAERIYRVAADIIFGGNNLQLAVAPAPMAGALVNDFPEVLNAVRFRGQGSFLVKKEDDEQNFRESRVVFADNEIFDIFTIPLVAGDPNAALSEPNSLVISQSTSQKYFAADSPIGRSLILDNNRSFKITGVFEDMPESGHFHFDFLASLVTLDESRNNIWLSNNFQTYLLLQAGADPHTLEAKLPAWLAKYLEPQVQQFLGMGIQELRQSGNKAEYYLQPLRDIHLHSDLTAEFEANGNINYVYIFSAIAFFILLIACINFINLSTARSANRAKEVGIRKVVGSVRQQLMRQFLTESLFLSVIALVAALGLVEIVLPQFNKLAAQQLTTSYWGNWPMMTLLFGITLLAGIVAGSYPALILSGFRPVIVLKGGLQNGSKSVGWLRSLLVVFQFAASVFLIIGTFTIKSQLDYIQNRNLGFNKEQVIILHDAYALGSQLQAFKDEVVGHSQISSGTVSGYLPVPSNRSDSGFWPEGKRSDEDAVSMQIWRVDHDYIKTLGMEVVAGRDFSRAFATDSSGIIINERAAKLFDFDDSVGKKIYTWAFNPATGLDPDRTIESTIIGVIKDFHFESLRENIGALGLELGRSAGYLSFRFQVDAVAELIAFLEARWREFAPGQPFAYSFLDDRFSRMYSAEQQVAKVFGVFAGLAIFTACLGLFGLASFTAEQRTKEIGIRKVLGASVAGIAVMFSKEFLKFVLIAGLIATPLAWFLMREWLANFAYRTGVGIEIFMLAIGAALIIAIATVSFQAIKAALSNPVKSLRYE